MDLQSLRYFCAVAKSQSLTGAARALGVSQPTVSVAIQNLEARLETTLFTRERNGVRLTATGEELRKYTTRVFALLDEAEERVRGLEKGDYGSFVIGCHESLGAYFLPQFMRALYEEHPGLEVLLSNDPSAVVREKVLSREVHFGIVVNPAPHDDLVMVELFEDAVDVLVAEGAKRHATREEAQVVYAAGPVIYAGRVNEGVALLDMLAKEGFLVTRRLVCGDLEQVKSLALAGLGVAVLPRRVAAYGHEGKLVRLHRSLPSVHDKIMLLYRADMHKTRASSTLKDALVRYGRTLQGNGVVQSYK